MQFTWTIAGNVSCPRVTPRRRSLLEIRYDHLSPREPTSPVLDDFIIHVQLRFPSGMKALGEYYHGKGLKYALYTAESDRTCGGYPASKEHEFLDARTFAEWYSHLPLRPDCSFTMSGGPFVLNGGAVGA